MTMRVACIVEEGKLGGPQISIATLCAELATQVDFTIIMPKVNSERFQELCNKLKIKFEALPITGLTRQPVFLLKYGLFFVYEILLLSVFLRRNGFSCVYVCGGSWQFKGLLAGKIAGCKILWHLNDTYMPKSILWIFRCLAPLANGFICASHRTSNFYEKYFNSSTSNFIIHPPVDTNYFSPKKMLFDQSLDEKKIIIGTVCNINPVKNLELLIKAFCKANNRKQTTGLYQLRIAGPVFDSQRKYHKRLLDLIESLPKCDIRFVGEVNDVRLFLSELDVYVCSSVSESGPMSLFEAMAMEKAVISTKVGDVSQILTHGKSGYIVDVDDCVAMSNYIVKYASDCGLRRQHGSLARKAAVDRLNSAGFARKHVNAFNKVFNDLMIETC